MTQTNAEISDEHLGAKRIKLKNGRNGASVDSYLNQRGKDAFANIMFDLSGKKTDIKSAVDSVVYLVQHNFNEGKSKEQIGGIVDKWLRDNYPSASKKHGVFIEEEPAAKKTAAPKKAPAKAAKKPAEKESDGEYRNTYTPPKIYTDADFKPISDKLISLAKDEVAKGMIQMHIEDAKRYEKDGIADAVRIIHDLKVNWSNDKSGENDGKIDVAELERAWDQTIETITAANRKKALGR